MSRPLFCALCICVLATSAQAQDTIEQMLSAAPPIVRVEEDWEFIVGDPLPELDCPQIVTVFGPTDANFGTHVVFEINHGTLPGFGEGGMQLQVWWNDWLIGYKSQHAPAELSTRNETVRYTTVTQLHDGYLMMYIKNGTSASWGEFGETGALFIKLLTSRDDLNPYDHNNSLKHSRVTFGANRVKRFRRRAIRFYSGDGLYAESGTSRFVHRLSIDGPTEQELEAASSDGVEEAPDDGTTTDGTDATDATTSEITAAETSTTETTTESGT